MRGIPAAIPLLAFALAGCAIIPPGEPARVQSSRPRPAPPPPPVREQVHQRPVAPPPAPAYVPPQPYARPTYTPSASAPPPAPAFAQGQELPPRSRTSGPLTFAALGETVRVGGVSVTPVSVLEDSRCPSNARCAWAGEVRLSIRTGKGQKMEISSVKPIRVADGTLELVETRPDKIAGSRNQGAIPLTSYRFGFRFSGGY